MSYKNNPLFVSYGLVYGDEYDKDYPSTHAWPFNEYSLIMTFWDTLFAKFPEDCTTTEMVEKINASGFHIEQIRDPSEHLRGWVFPSETERLAFRLKYGI